MCNPITRLVDLKERPKLQFNAVNYRQSVMTGAIQGLVDSIRLHGILDPLHVKSIAGTDMYAVINGNRRLLAYDLAELKAPIPCLVLDECLSTVEAEEIALVSNLQREDPNVVDTARGIARWKLQAGLTNAEAAKRLGLSPATVSRYVTILELDEESLTKLASGGITFREAYGKASKHRKSGSNRKRLTLKIKGIVVNIFVDAKVTAKAIKEMITELNVKFEQAADELTFAQLTKWLCEAA